MESLIDSMTGPASWPFWIGIGFGLLLYGLDRLMTWRFRRRVEKRLRFEQWVIRSKWPQHPAPYRRFGPQSRESLDNLIARRRR